MSISARIAEVRERIAAAERRAGRHPGDVQLLAVSKRVPAERLLEAVDAGVTSFGENRVQELEEKRRALVALRPSAVVRWELIGPLQSNKVRRATASADRISSVDRLDLLVAIARIARESGTVQHIAVQVNVDGDPAKSGFGVRDLLASLPAVREQVVAGGVVVDGLLTVGRLVESAEQARPTFAALRGVAEEVRAEAQSAGWEIGPLLSMGMSGDYEVAIEEGATQVRIGSTIFGARA